LENICENLEFGHFTQEEYLMKEGEEGDNMYIIIRGTVNILKQNIKKNGLVVNTLVASLTEN
jgi:CRP-like cAMP-binding protein